MYHILCRHGIFIIYLLYKSRNELNMFVLRYRTEHTLETLNTMVNSSISISISELKSNTIIVNASIFTAKYTQHTSSKSPTKELKVVFILIVSL